MQKSIETIWKNAFLDDDALVAPKINNIYEKKSIHIIDKFKRMFKVNLIAIVIASFVPLVWSFFVGVPITGIGIFLLLNWLVFFGQREMKSLKKIDKSQNSYQYLKAFDGWMKRKIELYVRLYTYFYPLFFLSFVVGLYFSEYRESILSKLIEHFPDSILIAGTPLFLIVLITIIAGLLSYFGGALYRIDLKMVYGGVIHKLDAIIADMDELRS